MSRTNRSSSGHLGSEVEDLCDEGGVSDEEEEGSGRDRALLPE